MTGIYVRGTAAVRGATLLLRARRAAGHVGGRRRRIGLAIAVAVLTVSCCTHSSRRPPPHDAVADAVAADFTSFVTDAQIRAIIVTVNGKTRFERYYHGATAAQTQDLHSVTKSVTSTLIGDAIADGRLRLQETLPQMLPQYAAHMTAAERHVTLAELLTMTGGFRDTMIAGGPDARSDSDWTRFGLANQNAPAPAEFHYSDLGVQLLSPILTQATGQPLLDYARSHLFDPLGIPSRPAYQAPADDTHFAAFSEAGFAWMTDPRGVTTTFANLKMRPRDMAVFGQLFLQGGRWNGRQLVPPDWVRAATTAHTDISSAALGFRPYRPTGYGYLWWVTTVAGAPAFFAWGFGGQLIEVIPQQQLVIVVATDAATPDVNEPLSAADGQRIAGAIAAAVRSS